MEKNAKAYWDEYISLKGKLIEYYYQLLEKFDCIELTDNEVCIFGGEYVESMFDSSIYTTDSVCYSPDDLYICDLINLCDFLENYKGEE